MSGQGFSSVFLHYTATLHCPNIVALPATIGPDIVSDLGSLAGTYLHHIVVNGGHQRSCVKAPSLQDRVQDCVCE